MLDKQLALTLEGWVANSGGRFRHSVPPLSSQLRTLWRAVQTFRGPAEAPTWAWLSTHGPSPQCQAARIFVPLERWSLAGRLRPHQQQGLRCKSWFLRISRGRVLKPRSASSSRGERRGSFQRAVRELALDTGYGNTNIPNSAGDSVAPFPFRGGCDDTDDIA